MAEETEVVLTANTQAYERSIDQATASTNKLLEVMVRTTTAIDGMFKSAGRTMQIGGAGMLASLTAMGVAAGKLDQQFSQLQASMMMVSKTQAEYQTQMKAYEGAVTNLRSSFGMTSQEAIGLVSQLNKLGQSSQNIDLMAKSFTRLSAISGEGVGGLVAGMVQLQRTMGTEGVKQTEVFNATLAKLSQNAGVSATAVTQFSSAIAPIGKVSGMTQREIMGVSTAFVKAGADGYQATNTFNKMLTDITRSIQYGSPELKAYSDLIGVSVKEFKEMPRSQAITRIFEQINKQGPGAIKTLERFGLDGVRSLKSIQAVAGTGGIGKAVQEAMAGPESAKFNEASDQSFKGLNDQMAKMAENAKMIGEAFGKGILPVMEGFAKAINMVLDPLNKLLQGLGKIPGIAMLLGGLGLAVAGTVTGAFGKLVAAGTAYGPLSTAFRGFRGGQIRRRVQSGGDLSGFSDADMEAYTSHEKWRNKESAPGNWLQHMWYSANQGVGGMADARRERIGAVGSGIGRATAGTANFLMRTAGSIARQGLDALSFRAQGNVFNRDQNILAMKSPNIADSLGYTKVKDLWQTRNDPIERAAREQARAMNTAHDSTQKFSSVLKTATHESNSLAKALAQAAGTTVKVGAAGLWSLGEIGIEKAGEGIRERGGLRGMAGRGLDRLGGGLNVGLGAAAAAGTWLMAENERSKSLTTDLAADTTNRSPFAVYAAAVGEAAQATKSFTESIKEADAAALASAKPTNRPSPAAVLAAEQPGEYANPLLRGATRPQAEQIAKMVMAGNPSPQIREALSTDLLRNFGTDFEGRRATEAIMRDSSNASRLNLGELYGMAYDQRDWWNPITGNDESQVTAGAIKGGIQEQLANAGSSRQLRSQVVLSQLNQMTQGLEGKGVMGLKVKGGVESAVRGFTTGVLGGEADPKDTALVREALQRAGNEGKTGEEAMKAVQAYIVDQGAETEIGKKVAYAMENAGPGFKGTSTEMPNTRRYASAWQDVVGIDLAALDRLRGITMDRTLEAGQEGYMVDTQPGEMNKVATALFGGGTRGGRGGAVATALANEGDVAAQWTGMNAITQSATSLTGSFSEAVAAVDAMTFAVGGAETALGALDAQARSRIRQAQSEAMGQMTTGGRGREIFANYAADLETDLSRPTSVSGANREESRQAAAAYTQQQFDRLKAFAQQLREFNISRERQEKAFELSREYAQDDFALQRKYAEDDFQKSRLRAEENFNHQVLQMTEQTAKSMTNIYEKMNVQRTWDAANLLQNEMDQQAKLNEHQANLARLRESGLTNATIEQMGLNDPAQMQQTARLTEDLVGNPQMVAAFNKASKDRMATAGKIVKDESNNTWQEMNYQFKKSMDQGEIDFENQMDRQAKQFDESMRRQNEAFDLSMQQGADDMNRSMEEVNMSFAELQKLALANLKGTARDQLVEILANVNSVSTEITDALGSTRRAVNEIFQSMGVDSAGNLTSPGGGNYMTGTIVINGVSYNRGQFAAGGEIPGSSPHPKADNIPIWATAGEYMLPVDAVNYYGKDALDNLRKKRIPKDEVQGYADGGMIWESMRAWAARNLKSPIHMTSGYRPGAITSLGNVSMHSQGKAIDLGPPTAEAFNKIKSTFGSTITQLIYSPMGKNQVNKGKNYFFPEPTRSDHFDHIHWGMNSFGQGTSISGAGGGAGAGGEAWDGSFTSLLNSVKAKTEVKAFSKAMEKGILRGQRMMGGDWLAHKIATAAFVLNQVQNTVDSDYNATAATTGKKKALAAAGALAERPTSMIVGESGPEAVIPLNARGVDFMFEVMKRNSTDSKRAMVAANGTTTRGSTTAYYSRIDKSTNISGPITVQAQDPDEMLRKIQAKKAMEALKGRH